MHRYVTGRTYGASAIKVHPYFKFTPQADRFDVAVVRLNRRVDFAPHISPICLPPKNMAMDDMHGWAAGWGALQPGSRLRPKTLQVGRKTVAFISLRGYALRNGRVVPFDFSLE